MSKDSEPRLQRISSELLEEYDSTELVASLLQELVEANDEVEVQLTFEKPLARKNRNSRGGGSRRGNNNKRGNGKFDNKNRRSKGSKGHSNKKKNNKNSNVVINKIKVQNQSMRGRTFADHQNNR